MKALLTAAGVSMLAGLAIGAISVERVPAPPNFPVSFVVENEITDVPNYLKEYAAKAR